MSSEEFKCIFCKESFDCKETLQVHFRKHGDKNFHQSKGRAQDVLLSLSDNPASSKDQADMVECDVCPEKFTSISKAITHKHKVHPDHDAKYFCPWCGKLFTMKHLYNKHIQTTHSYDEMLEKSFHCDVCNVDFHSPIAVLYHNKFFHRTYEMPAIGNSKKLKMISQEAVQIYYCPFCGEEYDNKVNLHKHMTDDHNDENQYPDDVLRCPVCDAIFYHLDAYELHLTYHCVDDMYSERSEILDGITDFSLETVPPIAEKVETLEPQGDEGAMGIEQLFEQTMDDAKSKKKKHKKHKKSKKSAITLDQFLNMNTDVFGEGLDFQGVEEVPSQIIAKRLKKPVKKPAQSILPPNIEKLKRQGIIIKKKTGTPTVKPLMVKTNKIINKAKILPQTKSNTLATPNDVLTKLINQNNSQIKIVKKSSLEVKRKTEDANEMEADSQPNHEDDKASIGNTELNGTHPILSISTENDVNTEENKKTYDTTTDNDAYPNNTTRKSQNLENKSFKCPDDEDESNHSQSILDETYEKADIPQTEQVTNVVDKLTALRNIVIKSSSLQSVPNVNKNNETIPSEDTDEDVSNREERTDAVINGDSNKNNSFNALKHLSHLIVKTCSQEKKTTPEIDNTQGLDKKVEYSEANKKVQLIQNSPTKQVTNTAIDSSPIECKSPLKTKETKLEESNFDTDEECDKPVTEPVQAKKLASILNSPHLNIQSIKKLPKVVPQKESPAEILPKNEKSSADILKHLKNVTAKPIAINKTVNMPTPSLKSSPKLVNIIKKEPVTPQVKHSKVIQEDIEIFNIDDSDSDETNSNTAKTKPENKETAALNKPADVLKNINKNISLKSGNNHNTQSKGIDTAQFKEFDSDGDDDRDHDDEVHHSLLPNNARNPILSSPLRNPKQSALNNVLKNLSKNITVKSGNASPGQFTVTQDQNSQDSPAHESDGAGSETDSLPGRVKIMEMDNVSDEEDKERTNGSDITHQDNVKVQYPDDSDSDDNDEGNHNEEFNENFSDDDIETHITANAVIKDRNLISHPNLDSLKNVCKDLVIKSSGQAMNRPSQLSSSSDEIPPFAKSLSNQISIKNLKPRNTCNKEVKTNNSNSKNAEQTVGRSINKLAINQNMALSSNQMNTVNKEVKTVKTFQTQTQTKTVIQEITTTVTKTIKTVNQSINQEIRNTGQSSMPKKIQQVNMNNLNFQGVKVRQTVPMAGPRIRNPGMRPTRPGLVPPIRASNQLVPVRPRFNPPRLNNPRMASIRPSISGQLMPHIGAQIRVATGVTTAKRPNTETPGHFSCFKKPKESLIPEADFSVMNNEGESSGSVQCSSAMKMSKSNFACTTKTVKGNSVVTSTHMKSEMSASSQQLGKLRNLSGLSVVKSIQANQSHIEEKSEVSAAKRNTLDALQKLQSQGLLVKKPRLVSEESELLNPHSDDDHFSDEEFGS